MSISILTAVTTVFALGAGNVSATGLCRALDEKACGQAASCRWIRGYERSDGHKVSPYCRKLPGKKAQKEKVPTASRQGSSLPAG